MLHQFAAHFFEQVALLRSEDIFVGVFAGGEVTEYTGYMYLRTFLDYPGKLIQVGRVEAEAVHTCIQLDVYGIVLYFQCFGNADEFFERTEVE